MTNKQAAFILDLWAQNHNVCLDEVVRYVVPYAVEEYSVWSLHLAVSATWNSLVAASVTEAILETAQRLREGTLHVG